MVTPPPPGPTLSFFWWYLQSKNKYFLCPAFCVIYILTFLWVFGSLRSIQIIIHPD